MQQGNADKNRDKEDEMGLTVTSQSWLDICSICPKTLFSSVYVGKAFWHLWRFSGIIIVSATYSTRILSCLKWFSLVFYLRHTPYLY